MQCKMWMEIPIYFTNKRGIFLFTKYTTNVESQTNGNSRWEPFFENCCRVIWTIVSNVQQFRWRCTSPWRWLEEIRHWSLARQRHPLLLQHHLIASKHSYNSLSSCGCSLPFQISVLKHLDVSSISPSVSVSFKAFIVVSLGWDSDFSGSLSLSGALYFRIKKKDGRAWRPDYGSSATRRHLQ